MLIFDEIARLDHRSIERILRAVDNRDMTLALSGAPDEVRERVFGCMSERAARVMREEIAHMEPARGVDIDAAQRAVAMSMLEIQRDDQTVLGGSAHDDFAAGWAAGWNAAIERDAARLRAALDDLDGALAHLRADLQGARAERVSAFHALGALDDVSIGRALSQASRKDLALALVGMPDDFRELAYAHMSTHVAGEICDEISYLHDADDAVIARAQERIGETIMNGLAHGTLHRRPGF